jgi:excisionase family DNA binding protein
MVSPRLTIPASGGWAWREVSPTDAAAILGVSRAQVRKLIDDGKLPSRMVGSHRRIRLAAIEAWLDIEDARQEVAMAELMALQNELGLTE